MFGISVKKACEICNGTIKGKIINTDRIIKRMEIDSRVIAVDDLFVAFNGANSDGHNFINSAFRNGACGAIAEHDITDAEGPVIVVDNSLLAMEKIALFFRETLSIPIICVTGSVGKTTTKEMIATVLGQHYKVHKTKLNLNNNIGLPMSISNIMEDDEVSVLELGINHFGEMRRLAEIAKPTIAVFTLIGHAHLEFLNDLNGVFKAKTEMLEYLSSDGLIIYNGDDAKLKQLSNKSNSMSYGLISGVDLLYKNNIINYKNRAINCNLKCFGNHFIYAAMAAACCGIELGLSDLQIASGIEEYEIVGRRGAVTKTDFLTIIDDSYNANPDSMKSSIASLKMIEGRKVCILGDMLEQGDKSAQFHEEIGTFAKDNGVDLVISTGKFGRYISNIYFETAEDLCRNLINYLKQGDIVLVKASRGNHLEVVADYLKNL